MATLQRAFTTVPALVIINFSEEIEKIIVTADANLKKWDAILIQIVKDRRCPFKYKNEI
jgi:hypothetical protein